MQKSRLSEEKEIRGEIEGYSQRVTPFPGNRGARGIKIENEFHNIVGDREFLESLETEFPKGEFVKFLTIRNKKGYWDVSAQSLKLISKDEAYGHMDQRIIPREEVIGRRMDREELERMYTSSHKNAEKVQRQSAVPRNLIDVRPQQEKIKEDFLIITKEQAESILERFRNTPGLLGVKLRKDAAADNLLGMCSVMVFEDEGAKIKSDIIPKNPKIAIRTLIDLVCSLDMAKDLIKKQLNQFTETMETEA